MVTRFNVKAQLQDAGSKVQLTCRTALSDRGHKSKQANQKGIGKQAKVQKNKKTGTLKFGGTKIWRQKKKKKRSRRCQV